MSEQELVSIVMPVRNAVTTVVLAIDDILAQKWREWELVVVDDGSEDGTPDVLQDFARRDPRVRVLSTPPHGIAKALQLGCNECRGAWISRMDADDRMRPERIEEQLRFARANPGIEVVSCLVEYGGSAAGYAAHVDWINRLRTPGKIALRRFVEAPVAHPSVMFRRCLLENHGGYRDGDFPEDYELWLRWLEAGVRFGKAPSPLLVWNDPPDRLSRTDPRYSVECFYQMKCGYLVRWLRATVEPARSLWLWGAGRITRRRFDALEHAGACIAGFIDVDPKKAGRHRDGRPVRMAGNLPPRGEAFLIVGVGNRGARDLIHADLTAQGWIEGRDFILAA